MGLKEKIGGFFTPSKDKKATIKKIFVGNGLLSAKNSNITIDLTELAKHDTYFKEVNIGGNIHYEIDLTIIPYRDGINKFGNSHYIIIKNK